jgi:hypothetical protein
MLFFAFFPSRRSPEKIPIFLFLLFCLLMAPAEGKSQQVFTGFADPGVESLLDELASEKVIHLNSVSKPYSRTQVASWLQEASRCDSLLTGRQKKEISLYLKNFSQELYCLEYPSRDDQTGNRKAGFRLPFNPVSAILKYRYFSISARPLIGFRQIVNGNDAVSQISLGIGTIVYAGRHLGLLAGIYRQTDTEILSDPVYLTPDPGGKWNRYSTGGGDFGEWFGQVNWSWKWGMIGIFKDRFQWGESYHGSNIFSGRNPSFPGIRVKVSPVRWLEFEYFHGWLSSADVESFRSETDTLETEILSVKRCIAANLLTVRPWKYLNISLGNSIVYDGGVQPAYLIPVLFYKSVDHTLSNGKGNQNSQMFLSIDSRQIRHLNLYLTLFIDEFKISRIWDKEENNFLSWKTGLKLSNWPVRNLSLTLEGTRTIPLTYRHYIPSIGFESDGYNLGHYLRDNSQELYISVGYRPLRGFGITLSWQFAQKGKEYPYSKDPDPTRYPVLKEIIWESQKLDVRVEYSLVSNVMVSLAYEFRSTTGEADLTPAVFRGTTHSLVGCVRIGF